MIVTMKLLHSYFYTLLIFVTSNRLLVSGTEEKAMHFDESSGQITFGPPSLDVEEESAFHMPVQLRCDGCRIIAHCLYETFAKEEKKLPAKTKSLSESQIFDIPDRVCSFDFKEYGITQVNGVKRLKGPGLDSESAIGVTQAGGRWPWRLQTMCNDYIGEFGEEEIYQQFRSASNNYEKFFKFLCESKGSDLAYCRTDDKKKQEL